MTVNEILSAMFNKTDAELSHQAEAVIDHEPLTEILAKEIAKEIAQQEAAQPPAMFLLGSGVLDTHLQVGSKTVTLGEVVARAHAESFMTVDEWNSQNDTPREFRIISTLRKMRAEAQNEKATTVSPFMTASPVNKDGPVYDLGPMSEALQPVSSQIVAGYNPRHEAPAPRVFPVGGIADGDRKIPL